ncbi:hypothetical protein L1987_58424 [Smallanthus sonchifolius]|uniref:Uncharacterized protein n=1 Tax=Smallanthus sonchifolius TaxID=185202 RepID=A0ACB9DF76_9ASTR|nr:hypothetical protein L1987_58424 [Smallanthus sonchifolius]
MYAMETSTKQNRIKSHNLRYETCTMEKPRALNFEVGQPAEMRSFVGGYRGAWFRCKDILLKENKILPEYYDFDPTKLKWEKIYQVPHYGRKLKHIKGQLMVQPQYPALYNKSEMPSLMSISQACVVTDGAWKVGDLVDWFEEGCHWSAKVIEVSSDDKVQIELLLPPLGQGGKHEAFNKDLRPLLVRNRRLDIAYCGRSEFMLRTTNFSNKARHGFGS